MAIGTVPAMFVSSTCYDLKQVRADLKGFIESLGLTPVLSDYDSFPVDPDVSAIDNCLNVVDARADLFVLIVGGRYGSTTEQGKSVTNMEYLRARAKGVPVYAVVQNSIINILPVWRANPDGNFQNVVDSPKLFEFVASLMDSKGVWVFPFEVAQEITDTLRKQLAYLFMDALQIRKRVKTASLPESLAQLQGMPLRLVIEQPIAWEYRLFAQVLAQEISRVKRHRLDLNYGIAFGAGEQLSDHSEVFRYLSRKMAEAERIVEMVTRSVNVALPDALGPEGTPADPEKLVYVAQRVAETYRQAIEWALECKRVNVYDDEYQEIVRLAGTLLNNMISDTEQFCERMVREIEEAINNLPGPNEEKKIINFTLPINLSNTEELNREMARLKALHGTANEEEY